MLLRRPARRAALLALSLLSGCAAADPGPGGGRLAQSGPDAAGSAVGGDEAGRDDAAHLARARHAAEAKGLQGGDAAAYLTGRLAGQQGDLDRATDAFLTVLSHDPDNVEVQQQAFLAGLLAARPEAARLATGLPANPIAQMLLASGDLRAGRWAAAEARYTALPELGLTQVLRPLLVAWAQAGSGRPDAALETLRPYADGERFRGVYRLHAAMIADVTERDGEATRLYAQTEADFPTPNLDVTLALASWQARHGDMAGARARIDTLVASSPEFDLIRPELIRHLADRPVHGATEGIAEAYLAMAAALRSQDAADYAALLVRLAIDLRPGFAAARLLSAEIEETARRPEVALATLAGIAPDDVLAPIAALRRAALLERQGDPDQALATLRSVAASHPDRPEPWALQGGVLRARHRDAEAAVAYGQAIDRIPDPGKSDWTLFFERGVALEGARRWPEAEADFEHALRLSPDQPSVLNYLGYSWTEMGRNLPRAREMIERAVTQRPNDGAMLDSLGWVLLRQGDVPGAVRNLERAVELEPEDATINGHLGDAYRAAGRRLEATFQWQRALTLNPEPDEQTRISEKLREAGEAPASSATAPGKPAVEATQP